MATSLSIVINFLKCVLHQQSITQQLTGSSVVLTTIKRIAISYGIHLNNLIVLSCSISKWMSSSFLYVNNLINFFAAIFRSKVTQTKVN